jgi:hypothetical protein
MGFESLVTSLNEFIWGLQAVILCLGTGIENAHYRENSAK